MEQSCCIFTQIDFLSDVSRNIILQAAACRARYESVLSNAWTIEFFQLCPLQNCVPGSNCMLFSVRHRLTRRRRVVKTLRFVSTIRVRRRLEHEVQLHWTSKLEWVVSSHVQDCATFGNKVMAGSMHHFLWCHIGFITLVTTGAVGPLPTCPLAQFSCSLWGRETRVLSERAH